MKLQTRLQKLERTVAKPAPPEVQPSAEFVALCQQCALPLFTEAGLPADCARLHPLDRDFWHLYLLLDNGIWYFQQAKGREPTAAEWQAWATTANAGTA